VASHLYDEMSDLNPHEEAVIRQLFAHDRRLTFLHGLSGTAKRRQHTLASHLCHFYDWASDCTVDRVPEPARTAEGIHRLLHEKHAPNTCHIMSSDPDLDGRDMELMEAVRATLEAWPECTIISCKPGRLAFYQDEYQDEAYIIAR